MKKLALLLAIPALMVACGGEDEKEKEEKKGPDIDAMAQEYCDCMDKESLDDMSGCLEEFKKNYEDVKGSDEQKKEFEEKVKEHCGDM